MLKFKNIKVGGIEPVSMLERPGFISSIIFLAGCNFRCPFCHNPELVTKVDEITLYPIEEIFKILKAKQGWVDSVIFTGGEPTLHSELPLFIEEVRKMGFQTGLHTNGTNPAMLRELLTNDLLDYVAMDVKNSLTKYGETVGMKNFNVGPIKENIKLMLAAKPAVDTIFRTTVVPDLVTLDDIKEIGKLIKGGKRAALQQFRPLKCVDEDYEKKIPYSKAVLGKMADVLEKYVTKVEREFI
jgi:pyruvate formate lyase activating enzyme